MAAVVRQYLASTPERGLPSQFIITITIIIIIIIAILLLRIIIRLRPPEPVLISFQQPM